MVFFIDRNLGKAFPRILSDAGLNIELHDDHFPPNTRDEDWLPEIGRRGWIAVTRDKRIRHKPNERAMVERHAVAMLLLIGDAPYPELAKNFVATRERIERFVASAVPPFIAKVYRASALDLRGNPDAAGRVERWWP